MSDPVRHRSAVDRLIDAIEYTAAGFLAAVTAITFLSVLQRGALSYFSTLADTHAYAWAATIAGLLFRLTIPDAYDLSALLLGILIFWGLAGAGYRGDHITVDLLWSALPRSLNRAMTVVADLVTIACLAVFTWMMAGKVISTRIDNVSTFDLRLPVWLFYAVAWLGLAAAVALLAVRIVRLVTAPERLAGPHRPGGIE
jgi:TRAP-type C4-dicarboxylate transport system permease small subunit